MRRGLRRANASAATGLGYFDADDDYHHCADGTVPTTVVLAIALDMMAVVAWISGRLERRPEYAR